MYKSSVLASFQYGAQIGDKIYGISTMAGVLLEYDIISNEIRIVGTNERMRGKWAYSSHCCIYKRMFIAVSNLSNELLLYNLDNNECNFITLASAKNRIGTFSAIFIHKDVAIIIPKYDDVIILYNLINGTIETVDIKFTGTKYDVIVEEDCLFILYEAGKIIKVIINNMQSQCEYYDGTGKDIFRLGAFDGKLYGLSRQGDILQISDCNCCEKICGGLNQKNAPGCFIKTNKGFVVLPSLSKNIYLDNNGKWVLINEINDDFDRLDDPMRSFFEKYIKYNDDIIFLTKKLDRFLVINTNTAETKWVLPKMPMKWEYYEHINEVKVIENEWSLSDFLAMLKRG